VSDYNEQEVYIRNGLRVATAACYDESEKRGWWDDMKDYTGQYAKVASYVFATKLALVHSVVSEALEGIRKDKLDEHLPHRKSVEVELADALIRIFDLAGRMKLDLGSAVIEKMRYNGVRPDHNRENRNAIGGKAI
jgi:NTP pyrophosphatase (non-canonical NTP hydrolase)